MVAKVDMDCSDWCKIILSTRCWKVGGLPIYVLMLLSAVLTFIISDFIGKPFMSWTKTIKTSKYVESWHCGMIVPVPHFSLLFCYASSYFNSIYVHRIIHGASPVSMLPFWQTHIAFLHLTWHIQVRSIISKSLRRVERVATSGATAAMPKLLDPAAPMIMEISDAATVILDVLSREARYKKWAK